MALYRLSLKIDSYYKLKCAQREYSILSLDIWKKNQDVDERRNDIGVWNQILNQSFRWLSFYILV